MPYDIALCDILCIHLCSKKTHESIVNQLTAIRDSFQVSGIPMSFDRVTSVRKTSLSGLESPLCSLEPPGRCSQPNIAQRATHGLPLQRIAPFQRKRILCNIERPWILIHVKTVYRSAENTHKCLWSTTWSGGFHRSPSNSLGKSRIQIYKTRKDNFPHLSSSFHLLD